MKISLVLGSGGARGYAHIGAIQELEARGHEIVAVAGASMGALVGGMYVAGKLDQFAEVASALTKRDLLGYVKLGWGPGLIDPARVIRMLSDLIGEVRIEDLEIPFTAVATDILARREIWFNEGSLLAAIRASIAIPGFFTPVMLNGRLLTDGGLVNPLPMETSMRLDADLTIAVSLFGRPPQLSSRPIAERSDPKPTLFSWLEDKIGRPKSDSPFDPLPSDIDALQMFSSALDVMQERIQSSRIAVNPPDVHVEVPVTSGSIFDFHEARKLIELGRVLTAESLDAIGLA